MKVRELTGFKSLGAVWAFQSLVLGVKMLPAYAKFQYEEFQSLVHSMSLEDQEKILREAALFVELKKEDVEALICFVEDANGVPYGASNINNLNPAELIDCIVAVCMKVAAMKISILSEAEKKKSPILKSI